MAEIKDMKKTGKTGLGETGFAEFHN